MPPRFVHPVFSSGKRPPLMLPRGLDDFVDFGAGGWPVALVIPTDAGLLDPGCWLWHGTDAANDPGGSSSVAP